MWGTPIRTQKTLHLIGVGKEITNFEVVQKFENHCLELSMHTQHFCQVSKYLHASQQKLFQRGFQASDTGTAAVQDVQDVKQPVNHLKIKGHIK